MHLSDCTPVYFPGVVNNTILPVYPTSLPVYISLEYLTNVFVIFTSIHACTSLSHHFVVFLTRIPVFFTALYTRILKYLIRASIDLITLQMYFFKMAVSIPPVNISHAWIFYLSYESIKIMLSYLFPPYTCLFHMYTCVHLRCITVFISNI